MQLLWQDETKFATLFTKKEQNQSGSVPKAAVDRNRTGTGITTHGILSPGRLPVPPLRQLSNCFLLLVINKRNDPEETRTLDLRRDRAAL